VSDYYVYIMTNNSGTLYVGVTNDLERRVYEHRHRTSDGFTKRYSLTRLVYYESTPDVWAAIQREKEIKGWVRRKKIALIASMNPYWKDLSEVWIGGIETLRCAQGDRTRHGTPTGGEDT
jgi:putative endonuclease